jgi:hypothetical protein
MADFSNYAEQGLQVGKTVPYEVTELVNDDGTHPLIHVEHLGSANITWNEEMIANAGSTGEVAKTHAERELANRDTIAKHCARRVERVFFSDGTPATDADITGFIRALPAKALVRLGDFVMDEGNFCKRPKIATPPGELAEK